MVKPIYTHTVDLSQAKAGHIAHFRCGGSAKINKIVNYNIIYFDGGEHVSDRPENRWHRDGRYSFLFGDHPFDIIRIEEPPFDWSTVKNGMCFKDGAGNRFLYIGDDPSISNHGVFKCLSACLLPGYISLSKEFVFRYPDGD